MLSVVKIGTGKAVHLLWALMNIYLGLYPKPYDIYKCGTPLQSLCTVLHIRPIAVLLHLCRVEWTLSVLAVVVKISSCVNLESKSPTLPSLTDFTQA